MMRARILWLLTLCAAAPGIAMSQGVADFYSGRTVTILVGSGPGGITDTAGRIIGRFIEADRHRPEHAWRRQRNDD